jgi:cyclic-di-AMP phosphodiesterase PgpH
MADIRKILNHSGKNLQNILFFLLSIIIIVAILPEQKQNDIYVLAGKIIIISSVYLVLYMFLFHFRSEVLSVPRKALFIILTVVVFVVLVRLVTLFPDKYSVYIVPVAIIPVIISIFFDSRLAFFVLFITIIICGLIVPEPFEFVFISLITGMSVLFSLTRVYKRTILLYSSLVVLLCYLILYFAIGLIGYGENFAIRWTELRWFIGNSLLILITYTFVIIFEKKIYFLSDTTLQELSDINHQLLRKFATEAPGSFQHSLQVANLAEEAARGIGANYLLVRAGSLYHDIGKITDPDYFIENQVYDYTPHYNLLPVDSARILINHVNEGVKIARKYKLPIQIIDFIRTHHGSSRTYYFYKKFLDSKPYETGKDEEFIYPGPKPFTKELAIVMMADAIEAASRTIDDYSEDKINLLVERMIDIQEQENQLSDAPLTLKDISDIKSSFKKRLSNMYHSRIAYPDLDPAYE